MNVVTSFQSQLPRLGSETGAETDARGGEQPSHVIRLLTIARRRKWVLIGSILVALLLGVLVTLLMTRAYTASSTLEIQHEGRNFTQVEGADDEKGGESSSVEFYQTQYGLLQARALSTRVASDLRLQDSPEFFDQLGLRAAGDWFENGRVRADAPPRDARIRAAGALLLKGFEVEPLRGSRLIQIHFTSPDPVLSKRVIDAWSVNFVRATLDSRYEATSYARQFLEQRLGQLRQRIDASERELVNYATREGIVNVPQPGVAGSANSSERSIAADDLANLNQELTRATAERVRLQSRLGEAAGATSEALTNGPISALRQRRAEMQIEMSRLLLQYDPEFITVRTLRTQMNQLDASIAREEQRVRTNIQDVAQSAQSREAALQTRVGQLKSNLLDLRRRSIQYNILQREVDTNRQLYDALLQRYKEIGVAGGVGVNNISVVDPAEMPTRPSSPRPVLNLLIALLGGLFLGAGLVFMLEQLDRGITDPQDVEGLLGTPLLGTVPKLATGTPWDVLSDRKSSLSEAYTSVRANLGFSTDHGFPTVLAVTSTRPSEGKTTSSYALALAVARSGRTVVLVDADMRSPSIHHLFAMENEQGLSNYLVGAVGVDALLRPSGIDGMAVITSGPHPPSAPELLSGDRLGALLDDLRSRFDHVVFDAPPVLGLADAPLLGSRVEGVVFVVESAGTHRNSAVVAINRLRAANAQLVGVILTKFNARGAHLGYEYNYGYGYGDNVKATT
jgi:capsular exopolysaccharide synthesis family protein